MSAAPRVAAEERPAPVLLGDRLDDVRRALAGGALPVALLVALGLVFLVAGLRPTTASFTHDGVAYEATCGIETVVGGSTWDALDTACGRGSGLRALAVAGGAALLLAGLAQLGWAAVRAGGTPGSHGGPVRPALSRPAGRLAAVGAVAGAAVAAGASLVVRSRLDAAVLTGDCLAGSSACADHSGWAGPVRVAGVAVALGCAAVLLHLVVASRRPSARLGVAVLCGATLLVLLALRPVAVEAGTGDDQLRATCGIEVLLAGHPQPSVTSACRAAMGSRAAAGSAGAVLGVVGVVLLWRARAADGTDVPDGTDGTDDPVADGARPRPARRQPLRAGAEVTR